MESIFIAFVAFVFGAVMGSFLVCQYDRIKSGWSARDITVKPSECLSCHTPLKAKNNIPLLSYVFQKGRCTYCDAPIPSRLFWGELGVACLFVILYFLFS